MSGNRPISPFEQTAVGPVAGTPTSAIDPLGQTALGKTASGPGVSLSSSAGPTSASDVAFLRPFGPYTRVEPLAEQGAMGLVARGYNAAFDRWELLKFLRSEHAQHPELLRQFQREGKVLARLSHPNVVQVFAIHAFDGRPCLAMEFLEGESLAACADRHDGKLPLRRWYELFLAAARGLAAAHEVGLLHRDLKPENLFVLSEKRASTTALKLIDFGLATADRGRVHDPSLVAAMSGGTPLYMAPELWRQLDASPRSDLFALGVSFYVTLAGRLPYDLGATAAEVAVSVCSAAPFLDIRSLRPDLPAPLAALLMRLIAKAPDDRPASADEVVATLVAASAEARERRVPGSGPYRGLASFSPSERDVFFGRESEVVEVLERLRSQGGLVLVGPSGAGKSSLALAGVVPAVVEGALGGGLTFRSERLEPRSHPVASLAAALGRTGLRSERDWLAFVRATPGHLGEEVRGLLPPGQGLLLVVDQLEELATLTASETERDTFARALGSLVAVPAPELRLLATVRADLMDRLFALEPLRPLLTRGFYPVRPLLGEALRRALLGPAEAAGYQLEDPAIADAIVADAARTPAALPLLSFAMASWWQARDEARRLLPTAAWTSLGGLGGALARHGDSVLASLGPEERAAAEQILLRLVSADGTRARATRTTLVDPAAAGAGAERALDRLLSTKLLHESEGEITIVHEALLTQWPALRELLASAGEDRAFRERVAAAARGWDAQGRPDGALWTDDQAGRLLRWFADTPSALGQNELAFVDAVRQRVSRRRLLVRSGVFSALAVAVTFALVTRRSEHELRERLAAATLHERKLEADYRRAEGARLRALAERQLGEDPALALTTAFESYAQEPSPALDVIAWRVRYRGLPAPLPLHPGGSLFALFSRPGDWIATGGTDGSVHVLGSSRADHARLQLSPDGKSRPHSVAFGTGVLAVGSSVGELIVARAPAFSPEIVGHFKEPVEHVRALAADQLVALAGKRLVRYDLAQKRLDEPGPDDVVDLAVNDDGAVAMAARTGGQLVTLRAGQTRETATRLSGVSHVALSPDGQRVLLATDDGTVRSAPMRNDAPGDWTTFGEKTPAPLLALSAGPDGASLAIGRDRTARLWLARRSVTFEASGAFAWSAARHLLLVADNSREVQVISLLTGDVVGRLQGASGDIMTVRVSPAGDWALVASLDGATRAYSLEASATQVARAPLAAPPVACAVSSDGVAVACSDGKTVEVEPVPFSAGGLRERRSLGTDAPPVRLALGPQGATASWASADRWTIETRSLPGVATPTAIAASTAHVALAGQAAGGTPWLRLAAVAAGEARPVALDEPVIALVFSPDGQRLAAATSKGTIALIDTASATVGQRLVVDPSKLEGEPALVSFSDDAASLVVGSRAGVLAIVPLGPGKPPRRLARLGAPVTCLDWSQQGRAVVASMTDGRRVVIDADTGQNFPTGASTGHPVLSCARSAIDDRFTFALSTGAIFLRLIDTAPLTMSKTPEAILDPATMPLASWRGLPGVWR